MKRKVLIAGWFSFELGHPTAGDILALNVTCKWVEQAGYSYDIAFDPPFEGGVDWRVVEASTYSHVVFVCGPFEQGQYEADFLNRFSTCRLIGLNLSMLVPLDKWNPFDLLLERNSSFAVRPDIVFLSQEPQVPVVGICLVEPYPGALDSVANEAISRLVNSRQMAVVYIDTRLDSNNTHLRTPAEIESLIARVDVLLTTRLHGTVLALKNNVPVLAIDPEAGGAKIVAQAEKIGWPIVFKADELDDQALANAFTYCLTDQARKKVRECRDNSIAMAKEIQHEFISELINPVELETKFKNRLADPAANKWMIDLPASSRIKPNWVNRLKRNSKRLVKTISYLTLPIPIYNFLSSRKR
ncbi:polysaccharide pyruvyl transferase family protein [Spirosoma endbachense]|uniref:Polysaccharide pyruvyl transferase family protein n=1 Tax=Spirosoma endbachense TaxID=2666025 RepID=A0A6P1VZC9_9BACT|nr:polysaccharide pyruvyl transferase family protein [Spirosoma endbachense]QHV97442.1 polysaccharide pyruvyl transferase family protein [Spirosoma endbachense]